MELEHNSYSSVFYYLFLTLPQSLHVLYNSWDKSNVTWYFSDMIC